MIYVVFYKILHKKTPRKAEKLRGGCDLFTYLYKAFDFFLYQHKVGGGDDAVTVGVCRAFGCGGQVG